MANWVLHTNKSSCRRGWSLIELLVVLAIISILGGISIPILRSFARNDMRDGARTVYTMLRAARMYAMSYNVKTAVVYELDGKFMTDFPVEDTLRNIQVRTIQAAQVMYRLPDEFGLRPSFELDSITPFMGLDVEHETVLWEGGGTFVPVPTAAGERVVFPEGYSLLLEAPAPEYAPNSPPMQVYVADNTTVNLHNRIEGGDLGAMYTSQYHPQLEMRTGPDYRGIGELGMMSVYVYTGGINYNKPDDDISTEMSDEILRARREPLNGSGWGIHPRMAHVFEPRGNLLTLQSKERYTLFFGPSPDVFPSERIWFVGNEPDETGIHAWLLGTKPLSVEGGNLIGIPIEIQRATGRVTSGS